MAGKKEYTLVINGVSEGIKDTTSLLDVLKAVNAEFAKSSTVTIAAGKASKERKAAISEEEKAANKLKDTQDKVRAAQEGANDAQIKANQELREAIREQTRRIQIESLAEGSIKRLGMELTDLRNGYYSLTEAERESAAGTEMLEKVQALDAAYKSAKESAGQYQDSVGNYGKALQGLDKLSRGIDGVSKTTQGLAQSLMGGLALMSLFGEQSEEDAKRARDLQKIIALLSIAQQVNNNVLKQGTLQTLTAAAADKVRTTQLKAKTAAEAASTKGTVAATVAQRIFNAVAAANPYVLLALALVGVVAALVAFTSSNKEAEKEQSTLNSEIEKTGRYLKQIKSDADFDIALAEALLNLRREAAKTALAVADANSDMVLSSKSATKEMKDAAIQAVREASAALKAVNDEFDILQVRQRTERGKKGIELQKEAAKTELAEIRAAQNERLKLIENGDDRARETLVAGYEQRIGDLRKRLATETNLTVKARKAINDQIEILEKQLSADLEKLEQDRASRTLSLRREVEDSRVDLIMSAYDRERTQTALRYDRQIEDLKRRLEEEKGLTEEQQAALTELILNAEEARGNALSALAATNARNLVDQQLEGVEQALQDAQTRIGDVLARDKSGLQLIDVDATRENLAAVNGALDEYIGGLSSYLAQARAAHEQTLTTLQEGTPEYEAEVKRFADVWQTVSGQIAGAQKQQEENTKASTAVQLEYYKDLFGKIGGYAQQAVEVLSAISDAWNAGLQTQIDDLNAQLETLNEKYDEAQKQREAAAENVEEIEKRLQAATGGTAEALKVQLQESMHARAEAEREEQRLAKEKEKREAEIAKKEKQMRRNELVVGIAQGIANTAESATKALTWGPILGPIFASILTGLGLYQVGIMTKQLTKLADGGELKGPSHQSGGMRIQGTNIEVEGGEYVVNKRTTAKNKGLLAYINSQNKALTSRDISAFLSSGRSVQMPISNTVFADGGQLPPLQNSSIVDIDYDRMAEAMGNIQISPVVSVKDIEDVSDEVTTVEDLAGF